MDLSNATPEEVRQLQIKELEILVYLKEICQKNNLQFFLAGGSCIGALRHEGFIPWDDDVDIFMPRDDYEKLAKNWEDFSDNSKYSLCKSDSTHIYKHAAMTVNDNDTTFINFRTIDQDVNQGIAVDIIPMDYLADGFFKRSWQRLNAVLFSIFINQRLPDNQGKVLRALTGLPLWLVKGESARYKIWSYCEKQMIKYSNPDSKNMVELVTGLSAIFRPISKKWFDNAVYKKFENTEMPVPVGYDEYLTLIFGNYMEMPPESSRKAKHHTAIIDTEVPFEEYKGTYYLK